MKQSITAPDGAQLHDEDAPPRLYGRQSFNGRGRIRCSANLVISDTAWSIVGPLSVRLEMPSRQQRIWDKAKRGDCRLLGKRVLNLIPIFFWAQDRNGGDGEYLLLARRVIFVRDRLPGP